MATVPIFSGGNGGPELVRSRAGSQTHHLYALCSWLLYSVASQICFAICVICWILVLEEESSVNWLVLQYSTVNHAWNRGAKRAFSFVVSHCIALHPSGEGASPLATCQPAISDLPPVLFPFLPMFLFLKAQLGKEETIWVDGISSPHPPSSQFSILNNCLSGNYEFVSESHRQLG